MVSPLLLRTIQVRLYPEPKKEIKVGLYAIGPKDQAIHDEVVKKK